jgi:hypothetical protein
MADHLAAIFEEAKRAGMANEDWAVGQYRVARKAGIRDIGTGDMGT